MSNQISLMLSSIFLAIFILFSGEIILSQTMNAKAMAQTEQIGLYLQKNGFYRGLLDDVNKDNKFLDIEVKTVRDRVNGIYYYTITTYKEYDSLTKMFDFMDKTIVCEIAVCQKM